MDWESNTRRCDGVIIEEARSGDEDARSGDFIAIHPDGRRITRCVCCFQRLTNAKAARKNADFFWPLPRPRQAA